MLRADFCTAPVRVEPKESGLVTRYLSSPSGNGSRRSRHLRFSTTPCDFAVVARANIAASRRCEPCLTSSPRPPALARLTLHVLAQRPIDACLIAFIGLRVALEPGDDIGVEAKCQLLLDGSIEQPALRAGPIEEFRSARRIDGAIGQRRQQPQFRRLLACQPLGSFLLHRLSF